MQLSGLRIGTMLKTQMKWAGVYSFELQIKINWHCNNYLRTIIKTTAVVQKTPKRNIFS